MNKVLKSSRVLVYIFPSILLLYSCGSEERNDLKVLDKLNKSLQSSAKNIRNNSDEIYKNLEERLYDGRSRERAIIWHPKAIFIKEKTAEIITFIDSLKDALDEKSNSIDMFSAENKLKENKEDVVYTILYKEKQYDKLYENLKAYQNNVLSCDSAIYSTFKRNSNFILPVSENDNAVELYNTWFKGASLISAYSVLSSFENSIRNMENETVKFCFNETYGGCDLGVDFIQTIICQSSNHIKANEVLEINAGIGVFSRAANPQIMINGKKVSCEDGVADYKFKGAIKPGKYFVPVIIAYTKPDGLKDTLRKRIEYTVDD